ncbi:hypothetical protein UT300005_15270 [Clostridium sp. CTA-5]
MRYMYLIIAITLICIAHYIRVLRWRLFVKIYEKPKDRNLVQALSLGYLFNFFLPFKLGDLFRAWYSGRKMKNGKTFALSTVIVDRYLDILVVGIIFFVFTLTGINSDNGIKSTYFYIFLSAFIMLLTIFAFVFRGYLKKILRKIASIFNETIECSLLKLCWSLICNFKDIFLKINKILLIVTTVGMWFFYLTSYYFFAEFISKEGSTFLWTDIFTILFAKNSIEMGTLVISRMSTQLLGSFPFAMAIYMIAPLIIILIISIFQKNYTGDISTGDESYLNLLPHIDKKERLNFLEEYFSTNKNEYLKNYLKINQDISIIRDFSAGSNATTMLCMNEKSTFFRKYAFGDDGDKLYQQVQWLQKYKSMLPLPQITKYEKEETYCYYDMPYLGNAVGLFNYAHSMPLENGWNMIKGALECLEASIYKCNVKPADKKTIKKYIEGKVTKNIDRILTSKKINSLQEYDEIIINGVGYKNLKYYEKYLSIEYLSEVFAKDIYSDIHGDLTIENIICTRDSTGKDDFYIIDPNTGNIHDCSNLDYAKLLQSIHGNYEFLMTTKKVEINKNKINFLFTKSQAYIKLHMMLKQYMEEKFSKDRVKSTYFHEIIHWLRLMPYKIEKDEEKSILFYAGLLIVLHDVIEMYGEDD